MMSLIRKVEKDILEFEKAEIMYLFFRYFILNLFLTLLKESQSNQEILAIQCAIITLLDRC